MKAGELKRVWCLYRVSTLKQVAADDDMPIQKNACQEFVKNKQGWKITKELVEKGVSGWSKKADERGALNTIKQGAIDRVFDVLLVFMFDRLGRREDETPLIVNFLNQKGIEVWSTQEGRRNTESHIDKLLNYISFWQSDGESQKTSMRVREAKKQLSEQGYFQGGQAPIGYKIIETDQLHWKSKDRFLKELAVEEEEAGLIKLIFALYVDRHMGYRKIVDYLNDRGYRNREGKVLGISTVQRILANPIYIGKKRYKGFDGVEGQTQPYKEALRIISDEVFAEAERIRNTRKSQVDTQDKSGIPLAGKLMFSGIAYCKYCGAKLSGNYLYRKRKGTDESIVTYRYRCSLNKGRATHESSTWEAKKYDEILMNQVKNVLSQLDISLYQMSVHEPAYLMQGERNLKRLDKEYQAWRKQLEKLQAEIGRSLVGESAFTPEQLSGAIEDITVKISENMANRVKVRADMEVRGAEVDIWDWDTALEKADDDLMKALLSKVIDKVILGKNEVEIVFNFSLPADGEEGTF